MNEQRSDNLFRRISARFKRNENFFGGRNRWFLAGGLALLVVFFLPNGVIASAQGTIGDQVLLTLVSVVFAFVSFLGELLINLVGYLIYAAQYNGFVTSPVVTTGWVILRDVANMFFIVGVLLIAFGTMLFGNNGSYHYSKNLPRLVIMAIVINFSRTICGLIIDFSQIVMLTFVNGFKEAAAGNFINGLQINQLLQMDRPDDGDTSTVLWEAMLAVLLALLLTIISIGVVAIMIWVLVTRIVYLWLLTILSPLAFVGGAIPLSKAKGIYDKWWGKFNDQVLVGPFMAFFLWLALIQISTGDFATQGFPEGGVDAMRTGETLDAAAQGAFGQTVIGQYIIAIVLLVGGVSLAKAMSGAVGQAITYGKKGTGGSVKLAKGLYRGGKWIGNKAANTNTGLRVREAMNAGTGRLGAASRNRQAIADKTAKSSIITSQLSDAELKAISMQGIPVTSKGRANYKVVMDEINKRATDPTSGYTESKEDYHLRKKRHIELGRKTNTEKEVRGKYIDYENRRPTYIIDPNATGQEREEQVDRFVTVSKRAGKKQVLDTPNAELSSAFVANVGSSVVSGSLMDADGDKQQALFNALGMSKDEQVEWEKASPGNKSGLIRDAQERIKTKPVMYDYVSDKEKLEIVKEVDQSGLAGIGTEKVNNLFNKLDDQGRGEMADNLAIKLDPQSVNNFGKELADAIRTSMGNFNADPAKIMEAGGSVDQAFGQGAGQGKFESKADGEAFKKWLKGDGDKKEMINRVAKLPEDVLASNGGINDFSVSAVKALGNDGVEKLSDASMENWFILKETQARMKEQNIGGSDEYSRPKQYKKRRRYAGAASKRSSFPDKSYNQESVVDLKKEIDDLNSKISEYESGAGLESEKDQAAIHKVEVDLLKERLKKMERKAEKRNRTS